MLLFLKLERNNDFCFGTVRHLLNSTSSNIRLGLLGQLRFAQHYLALHSKSDVGLGISSSTELLN